VGQAARPRVVVVGLGPAGPEHLAPAARQAMEGAAAAFVRTSRHPAAGAFAGVASFDHLYEAGETFDEVYRRIVDQVVAAALGAAGSGGTVAYAVPGSPLVAERTVELLRADPRVDVTVVPALSFLDLAWDRLGVDPVTAGVRLVDATAFATEAAGERGPLLVAQCWSAAVLSEVKLALEADGAEPEVVVLHHLGLPDEQVVTVGWWDIDRTIEPDHLTSMWIPRLAEPLAAEVVRLDELVRTLRQRCPWDREQTHASLARHLLEESYEALDAIAALARSVTPRDAAAPVDPAVVADLCEELGDVLFQVVFHAALAREEGFFTLADVARGVHDKLVGRHPHVFGDVVAATPDAVAANWEILKKHEKGRTSVTDGIPTALPALSLATKLLKKAEAAGLSPADLAGVEAGLAALAARGAGGPAGEGGERAGVDAESLGRMLFALADLARTAGVDPEEALRAAALSLRDRIVAAESSD
jgi:tetrapyrrole methylase family protein/MazG family protein